MSMWCAETDGGDKQSTYVESSPSPASLAFNELLATELDDLQKRLSEHHALMLAAVEVDYIRKLQEAKDKRESENSQIMGPRWKGARSHHFSSVATHWEQEVEERDDKLESDSAPFVLSVDAYQVGKNLSSGTEPPETGMKRTRSNEETDFTEQETLKTSHTEGTQISPSSERAEKSQPVFEQDEQTLALFARVRARAIGASMYLKGGLQAGTGRESTVSPDSQDRSFSFAKKRQNSASRLFNRKSTALTKKSIFGNGDLDLAHGHGPGRAATRDPHISYPIREAWTMAPNMNGSIDGTDTKQMTQLRRGRRGNIGEDQYDDEEEEIEVVDPRSKGCSRLIIRPYTRWRAAWSIFGMLLVLGDVITVPLLAFDLSPMPLVLTVFATVYWTCDIVLTFITAYEANGQIEMRPQKIALRYMKTWLLLDLVTVVPEWIVFFVDSTSGGDSASSAYASVGDMARLARFFRCFRLLRVMKMGSVIEKIQALLNSEFSRAAFSITKHVVFTLTMNHFLACAWWGIGRLGEHFRRDGWIVVEGLRNDSKLYQYFTSLHWALSQLHGTMEVYPRTVEERAFAVSVLVITLIYASWIVSSITNMMIQVQQVHEATIRDKAALRKYLAEHRISTELSLQVKKFTDELLDRQRMKNEKCGLIDQLPERLRIDLELEIHGRTLTVHALFDAMMSLHIVALRAICHNSLECMVLMQHHVVFSDGEIAQNMYFVVDGTLSYKQSAFADTVFPVSDGEYVSEMGLWLMWVHLGDFVALGMCNQALAINASKFEEVVKVHRRTGDFLRSYARSYAENLSECRLVSDLTKVHH